MNLYMSKLNKNLEFNAKVKIKNYNSIVDQEKEFKLSLVIMFSKKDIEIRNNKYDNIKEVIKKRNLYKGKLTPKFNYDISYKIWEILGNKWYNFKLFNHIIFYLNIYHN